MVVSYSPLYFCISCCNLSFFISHFVDFILYFFLISLAEDLSILFIFSNNHLLVLLIFTIFSFISFSFISTCSLWFLPSNFGIFSSFSSCFRCKVRLSIRCFSCFLRLDCIAVIALKTQLKTCGMQQNSPKREVYHNTILSQETRKTLNRKPNFTPKTTGKRTTTTKSQS